jgi:hypothetical protein
MAGEPEIHKKVHVEQMRIINTQKAELEKQFEEVGPELLPYIMQTPEGQKLQELDKIANVFAVHLMEDAKPKSAEVQSAVESAQPPAPQQPQVPMPPGLTPAGSGQPPMPAAGNQQGGMGAEVPPQGRPPMAEAGI